MRLFTFALMLFFLVYIVNANEDYTPKIDGFQLTAGAKSYKIEDMDDYLKGMELTFGTQYYFTEKISGKTSLDISYSRLKYNYKINNIKVAESSLTEYTYGILQSFYYNGIIGSVQFRPFLNLGLGNSLMKQSYENILGDNKNINKYSLYFKYGAGFQVLSMKGVGGEFKFNQQRNKDYTGYLGSLSIIYTF